MSVSPGRLLRAWWRSGSDFLRQPDRDFFTIEPKPRDFLRQPDRDFFTIGYRFALSSDCGRKGVSIVKDDHLARAPQEVCKGVAGDEEEARAAIEAGGAAQGTPARSREAIRRGARPELRNGRSTASQPVLRPRAFQGSQCVGPNVGTLGRLGPSWVPKFASQS